MSLENLAQSFGNFLVFFKKKIFLILGTNLVKKAIYAMVEGDCDEVSLHVLFYRFAHILYILRWLYLDK